MIARPVKSKTTVVRKPKRTISIEHENYMRKHGFKIDKPEAKPIVRWDFLISDPQFGEFHLLATDTVYAVWDAVAGCRITYKELTKKETV